jgi:hypothetical protein
MSKRKPLPPGEVRLAKMDLNLAKVVAEALCHGGPTPPGIAGHDVQFYRTDEYLTKAVVAFLAEGVRAGQPIIVVATEAHRLAFAEGLRARGLDPDAIFSDRLAVWLDARETLASFMEGKLPDRGLFMATVGRVFESLLDKRYYLVIRGYGEMVDLLLKDGNTEAAILVEQYWNELAERYKYSLLCGYSVDTFLYGAGFEAFRRVCGTHTHALPLETLEKNVA